MAPAARHDDPSETDIMMDDAPAPKQTVINRKVTKAPKKRSVIMKRARSPVSQKTSRAALKDRTNLPEEGEDSDLIEAAPKTKARKVSAKTQEDAAEPKTKKATASASGKARAPKVTSKKQTDHIPETQGEDVSQSVEIDETMQMDEPEVQPAPVAPARSSSVQRRPYAAQPRARSASVQPRTFSREGSASLAERRMADSENRRKLAEMTSRYEDMRLKYEGLSELGTNAAESNFDKLKRATDQRARDASDLMASLKKELSEARKSGSSHTADNARLHTRISALESTNEQAAADLQVARASLAEAQNEIKSLHAKLEAARKAASAAALEAAGKTPLKSRDGAARAALTSGNLDNSKQAALKEELYRDLTGLIINSIKRKDGEDEYSCIQTGRNGTLHFHLTVNNDAAHANPKTPSGLSYEDAEFAYEPFFDEGRDRDLIDILPDYLTEEICFPRGHAVKFYTKVVDSMTKKVVIEE